MALPTKEQISNFDYSYLGQPFVRYAAKSTIDVSNFDYSYLGQPYSVNSEQEEPVVSAEEEDKTIFNMYGSWKNIYSSYKMYTRR